MSKRILDHPILGKTEAHLKKLETLASNIRQVILTSGEVFEAETVIVAAGYESRYITRTVGIDIPMTRYFEEASYDGVPVISKIDEMDASNFKNLFENLYNYEK